MWNRDLEAMGVAPLVGTEVLEFKGDQIAREWWVLSPTSLIALQQVTAPQ